MADRLTAGEAEGRRLFARAPPRDDDAASAARRAAFAAAFSSEDGTPPPVNIRLSLPLPLGRWYVSVFAGRERRNPERLKTERAVYPLQSLANAGFVLIGIGLFYAVAAFVLLLCSSVLDF